MPSHNCRHPTCTVILPRPGWCPAHQPQAHSLSADRHRVYDRTKRNMEAKAFYDSALWKVTRAAVLAKAPWCEECKRAWATQVHHVIPLAQCTPRQRTDPANLKPVCDACHTRIENRTRAANRRAIR